MIIYKPNAVVCSEIYCVSTRPSTIFSESEKVLESKPTSFFWGLGEVVITLLTVPVQFRPSPVYPGLQVHTNDPFVLLQTASTSQL